MRRLNRRLRGTPSVSAAMNAVGVGMAESLAKGVRDPRPLSEEDLAALLQYSGGVARRAFPALYDGE